MPKTQIGEKRIFPLTPLQAVFILFSVSIMAFIFFNSAATADESAASSSSIVVFLNEHGIPVTSFMIRKAAHFSEFAALGASLFFAWGARPLPAGVLGILYAVSDELHQRFVPGRSCEVRDMLIDAAGVVCGILFVWISVRFIRRCRRIRESR